MSYSDPTQLDTYPLAEAAILHQGSAAFYGADAGDLAIFLHKNRDLWDGPGKDYPWNTEDGFLDELRRFTDFDAKIKKIIELCVDSSKETTFEDFLDTIEEAASTVGWSYIGGGFDCSNSKIWACTVEVRGDFEFDFEFTDDQEDLPIEDRKIKVTSGVVSWGLK